MNIIKKKKLYLFFLFYFSDNIINKLPRVICHVFESEEASFIAQSIGQAFQVAYIEFLRANGIDDPIYLKGVDYQVFYLIIIIIITFFS